MAKYCQTNEDEIINYLMSCINIQNGLAVEFGGGDGYACSNVRHLKEQGWNIIQFDMDNKGNNEVIIEHITVENINEIFNKHNLKNIDLLSIDIDGNDYWVWKALQQNPKIIVIEYNPNLGTDESKTIKYNPDHTFKQNDYFGASWQALKKLGESKGYSLVNTNGLNMFFVLKELSKNISINNSPPPKKNRGWPKCKNGEWIYV